MLWIVEESADCGVTWHRSSEIDPAPRLGDALLIAIVIIQDEWRPPRHAVRLFTEALATDRETYFWFKGIRIITADSDDPAWPTSICTG